MRQRCVEIGYRPDVADVVSLALPAFLTGRKIGVIRIADFVAELRGESTRQDDYLDDDDARDRDDTFDDRWGNSHELMPSIASKGNALAHYSLALIHAPGEEDGEQRVDSDYWYSQAQQGRVLTGVEREWADAHAAYLANAAKYAHHLREAARLGQQDALLEMADRFDDPTFLEQADAQVNSDPALVAEIAERLGRPEDARKWLTAAAESGDTEAMRRLIEDYDHADLQRCRTWIYLAELFETDLTKDEYYAIHEDGSPYDDDVGGPAFVDGRDGVKLDPIAAEQDAAARRTAKELFEQTNRSVSMQWNERERRARG